MSFLSSIFPTSSGTPANGAPAPARPPVPAAPAAPVVPDNQQQQQQPAAPTSPLDAFADLWKNPTTADGKPAPLPVNTLAQPIFNFDPAKITESANKMDFVSGIPPETVQKALGGDPAAFADAINSAIRQAVVGMTMSNGNLINQAVVANNERVTSSLPTQIKKVQLAEVDDSNPVFSHPAAQPLIQSLKQMAFAKNPNATPAEINKQISDYIGGLASAVVESSPAAVAQRTQVAKGEQDWSTFLN